MILFTGVVVLVVSVLALYNVGAGGSLVSDEVKVVESSRSSVIGGNDIVSFDIEVS